MCVCEMHVMVQDLHRVNEQSNKMFDVNPYTRMNTMKIEASQKHET